MKIFNPKNLSEDKLPIIYGCVVGHMHEDVAGIVIAEDGTILGNHVSSDEQWLISDLGISENGRQSRHRDFENHYPNGYKTMFVSKNHEGLEEAFRRNRYSI